MADQMFMSYVELVNFGWNNLEIDKVATMSIVEMTISYLKYAFWAVVTTS